MNFGRAIGIKTQVSTPDSDKCRQDFLEGRRIYLFMRCDDEKARLHPD